MDNHSTTQVDPRVVAAMLPFWTEQFGNAGSTSHPFGWDAAAAVDAAREQVAASIGASSREIVFTSGATESNNLAIRGLAERKRRAGNHLVSVATEHKAILDPLRRLARTDFDVELLSVNQQGDPATGWLDPQVVGDALREETLLVSVMLVNNEIGVLQSLGKIAEHCRARGVPLHCDATQALGRVPVDVESLGVDLLSLSAHKVYGPKGVGALYVRRKTPPIRLSPLVDGGGQESGRRSGTLNVPGIVGLAECLRLADASREADSKRLRTMSQRLWDGLQQQVSGAFLNGPGIDEENAAGEMLRVSGNLNCCFPGVDGEALMMSMRNLAVSSGSACTSTNPEPSHVLQAIGLSDDQSRASLRLGLGRFNTEEEVDFAVELISETVQKLRKLG